MGTKSFAVGIDFGTSTSEICIYKDGTTMVVPDPASPTRSPILPSLVAVDTRGNLLVGEAARPLVDLEGRGVREVKRELGRSQPIRLLGKDYQPTEIASVIIRRLKENAEEATRETIREVVLSVPANFPNSAREATKFAGKLAGLEVLRLINEPTAAALAFGIKNVDLEEQVVIFDFGGGTLDISVLEMMNGVLDVKCSFGDTQLGGKDFDKVVADLLVRRFRAEHPNAYIPDQSLYQLKGMAELTKVMLSRDTTFVARIPCFGVSTGELVNLEMEISRTDLEQAYSPLLDRARQCIRAALAAGTVNPSAVNRIVLVGGSTYIPSVRRLVAEELGKDPSTDVDPDLAVAIGSSLQAALVTRLIDEEHGIVLVDVCPLGLGIEVAEDVDGRWVMFYESLISPQTKIPYSVTRDYQLLRPDQDALDIHLYQDPTGKARHLGDVIDTGIHGTIADIPPAILGEPHQVKVDFAYDIDGIARLRASVPATDQLVDIVYKQSATHEKGSVNEAIVRTKDLWRQTARANQYLSLVKKAQKLAEELPPNERALLLARVEEMQAALTANDPIEIDRAAECLTDILFDLETGLGA